MLYANKETAFDEKEFLNPSSEYRGAPFWAWNCAMNEEDIDKMMEMFGDMGMGGAHLHSRTGMNIPYLKEDFMKLVRRSCDRAKEQNMKVWLYDEDRWPSGFGGGYVTEDERYRTRVLLFSPKALGNIEDEDSWGLVANGQCTRSNNRRLLAMYSVTLDEEGWLQSYRRVTDDTAEDKEKLWYAYLEISGMHPWFNGQAYSNNLDPETVKRFIEVTHEAYYEAVGDEFGKTIPAIFTDEPQFSFKKNMVRAQDRKMVSLPFTDDFPDTYREVYGEEFMDHLPEVFFDRKDVYPVTRYRYHDHLTERFVSAYADQLGAWCEKHQIALTGHVMRESSLKLQTQAVGEAMRSYRSMQIPGIDMLAWRTEFNTAKQCQSAVHQFGREAMLDELYGVTNWDFDFRGHKLLGDWQAALGVNIRVHHLSWTSMAGEAKRDYPAAISYQSPWYKEYPQVENYFARVNTALTRGQCEVHLGVLHPIESYWLTYGTEEKTGALRRELDSDFDVLTGWLIGDTKDFDLIAESLVERLYKGSENGSAKLGEMSYSTILAPNMLTMRSKTLKMLREFKNAGGRIVFAGHTPEYLDGMPNEEVKQFAAECEWVSFEKHQLLNALDGVSPLEIFGEDGVHTSNLLTQIRQDGEEKWIFVAHKPVQGQEKITGGDAYSTQHLNRYINTIDRTYCQKVTLKMAGSWSVKLYDAWNGRVMDMETSYRNGATYLETGLYTQDSLLLRLSPAEGMREKDAVKLIQKKAGRKVDIARKAKVTLSEPNVLLLDMAEYAFDEESWQPREEILRIDNKFRERLGLQCRMEAFPQPWTIQPEAEEKHTLHLRFTVSSEIAADNIELALEHPELWELCWNGEKVDNTPCGRYVDRDIYKVVLGSLKKGENVLTAKAAFGQKTDVEAMYLLGDFGVRAFGDEAVVTEPVREMHFSDWVMQGLPFYGGNVTYHLELDGNEKPVKVALTKFRSPVIAVDLDGKRQGVIAISPYAVTTEPLSKGRHQLDITVFGNRYNTFGTLHNTERGEQVYCAPNFWRTTDDAWAYEYQFHETGALKAPEVTEIED